MRLPKRYGESRIDRCPFCQRQATATNKQGVPVCMSHVGTSTGELKCVCGRGLDLRRGKFGIFYSCVSCGALSPAKAFSINTFEKTPTPKKEKAEFVVRADDPRFFD